MPVSLLQRRLTRGAGFLGLFSVACACLLGIGATSAVADSTCTTSGTGVVADFCFPPTATTAGSAQNLETTIDFDYGSGSKATVQNMTVTLAPGLLAVPTAVTTTCTQSELQLGTCPPASQVGTGTVVADEPYLLPKLVQLPAQSALYEMDVPSTDTGTDVAYFGLDIWLGKKLPAAGTKPDLTANASASIATTTSGQPAVQFSFDGLPTMLGGLNIQVQTLTLQIDGTTTSSDGTSTAYTRLPTSCALATTTLSVDTFTPSHAGSATGAVTTVAGGGADSFTPTGCSALPFTPTMSATATKDASDLGVDFVSTITQPAGQAAASSITLDVPADTLGPNLLAAAVQFGDVVGSATAVSPLLPFPLVGAVTLTGTVASPALTIGFPKPVPLTLTGSVDIVHNSVTFANLPDVPLSALAVTINGGPGALYDTTCQQPTATLTGSLTGQNGLTVAPTAKFTIAGCPTTTPVLAVPPTTTTPTVTTPSGAAGKQTPPKLSHGSLSGLGSGTAKLSFTLTAGSSKLSSFTVSLPGGLSFDRRTFKRGVSIAGASVRSLALSGGKLTVTLRAGASRVTVKLSAKAIAEVPALRRRVKSKKVRTLTAAVVARTQAGTATPLKLTLHV